MRSAWSATADEKRAGAAALLLAPLVEGSLLALGLRPTLRWIERLPLGPRRELTSASSERLVRAAFRLQPLLQGRCLARALVQHAVHRLLGSESRFVVGVRRHRGGALEAHAWTESPEPRGAASDDVPCTAVEALDGYEPILRSDAVPPREARA